MEYRKKYVDNYKMQIYDVLEDRVVTLRNAYSRRAKQIYRQYIELGYEPELILPQGLKYYPDRYISGTHCCTYCRQSCGKQSTGCALARLPSSG